MYKLDLEKAKEPRDQIANVHWIIEQAREFQKNIYFCFINYAKAVDCVDHNKLCKLWKKRWEYQTTWPAFWETGMQAKKQQNWTWKDGLVQNWERNMSRLYIVTLLI